MENVGEIEYKKDDLTVEELKSYPGNENLTDEEAEKRINSIKELCILVCYAVDNMFNNKPYSVDYQCNK